MRSRRGARSTTWSASTSRRCCGRRCAAGCRPGACKVPALRMICEREEEIAAFMAQEYWTLDGEGAHSAQQFPLKLLEYRGAKVEQFSFTNEAQAREVERTVQAAAGAQGARPDAARARHRAQAAPPQPRAAVHHLDAAAGSGAQARFQRAAHHAARAAAVRRPRHRRGQRRPHHLHAHRLGVDGGRGGDRDPRGRRAAVWPARKWPTKPRIYKTKSKNAQEAHEAIRPTSAAVTPADVEGKIEDDLYRLYALIWKRAVASQMSHAMFDTVAVDMLAGADGPQRHLLRANGSTLVKPGYIAVYQEGSDDTKIDDGDHVLPAMREGDDVSLDRIRRQPAFHRAAAALRRGVAGQGAGGAWHRPALDLRHHHLDAAGSRVRRDGQPALRADRYRQDRLPLPDASLPPLRGVRLHCGDGG